MLIIFVNFV